MMKGSRAMTTVAVLLSAVSVLSLLLPSSPEVLHFVMVTATVLPVVIMLSSIRNGLQ